MRHVAGAHCAFGRLLLDNDDREILMKKNSSNDGVKTDDHLRQMESEPIELPGFWVVD
jgi:hypothetical protein